MDSTKQKNNIDDAVDDAVRFRQLALMIPVLLDRTTFNAWLLVLGREAGQDGSGWADRLTALREIVDERIREHEQV